MDSLLTLIDVREYMNPSVEFEQYLITLSDELGVDVVSEGRGSGSLETEETAGLDYRVTTGDHIREHSPYLWGLYNDDKLRNKISRISGNTVRTSKHIQSGININDVKMGGRYEAHVDSTPYTLLVFGSDHKADGFLEVQIDDRWHSIMPQAGIGVLFDGMKIPHRVQVSSSRRLTVPMVFVPEGFDELAVRAEVDGHLYG